jgi:hypothetical protein
VNLSISQFDDRAAAAIYALASSSITKDDGTAYWEAILAYWVYGDYFNGEEGDAKRAETLSVIRKEVSGKAGTGGDYEFDLNYAIPLIYRYYAYFLDDDKAHIILDLMSTTLRSSMFFPYHHRMMSGRRNDLEDLYVRIYAPFMVAELVETENHLLGIATVKYLTNQLLYQQEVADAAKSNTAPNHFVYDNNRNGGDDVQAVTVWILQEIATLLRSDFQEYNAKNYQIESLSAILNLATYAYDGRVKLAARMLLDYISAKAAVSSNDLRRAPPFRRRNEDVNYGPKDPVDGHIERPLVFQVPAQYPNKDNPIPGYNPDPLLILYGQLAGNISMLWKYPYPYAMQDPPLPWQEGFADMAWAEQMVHAAICDYRIPPSILDLFVTNKHRRFFQRLHHNALKGEYADEIYAGSPSYLITAGGHPTDFAYRADIGVESYLLATYLGAFFVGATSAILAAEAAEELINGASENRGAAMPTTFIPTGEALDLKGVIQFGIYTADAAPDAHHMGVAPDFACGYGIYLPPSIHQGDPRCVWDQDEKWIFVDRSNPPDQPGYYLAIRMAHGFDGRMYGCLEAYDTLVNYGTDTWMDFGEFQSKVKGNNSALILEAGNDQINAYVMLSGQQIQFKISPHSEIVTPDSAFVPPPEDQPFTGSEFAYGTIIHSGQGSAYIKIMNPALGTTITLDMTDPLNPVRTSETGLVEKGGVPDEVWVNFNYTGPGAAGDCGDPCKTLAAALAKVVDGGTIKIMPGKTNERPSIQKRVRLVAPIGGVRIGGS